MNNKILIIGAVWPEPTSSAAGVRMMQLIRIFDTMKYEIHFASNTPFSPNSFDLNSIGVKIYNIEMNSDSFDLFITDLAPKIVLFDRYITEEQFGWRVEKNYPDALKILDTEDLHFLRKYRQKNILSASNINIEEIKQADETKREILSILRCDLSLIISGFELELLENVFGISKKVLFLLEFPVNSFDEQFINYDDRDGFAFIGNFHHPPNVDSVQILNKNIWPEIFSKNKNLKIYIYGAYPSQAILHLHQPQNNFFVLGKVEDAKEVLRKHKIVLAPLRFGAGIKGKIIDAINVGTPVLTSYIGAEGIGEIKDWNGFVFEDFQEFARQAVLLYEDESKWNLAQNRQAKILKENFDVKNSEMKFIERLNILNENLMHHRMDNYLITILQHDTINSKKYLSKWIELKNSTKKA